MSAYTYGLTSPLDHLQQARHELRRLEEAQNMALPEDRKLEPAYLARNLVTTIWHITDAVAKTDDPAFAAWRAAKGLRRVEDFQEEMRKRSNELRWCWELANGSKHIRQKPNAELEGTTISAVTSYALISPPHYMFPRIKAKYRPKIEIRATGEKRRATEVFGKAIADVEDYLRENGLMR